MSDGSPFVQLLKTQERVKILDVLLRHSYIWLSKTQISERTGVTQATVEQTLNVFQEIGVIATDAGSPPTYRVDDDNPVVQGFENAQNGLLKHSEVLASNGDTHVE